VIGTGHQQRGKLALTGLDGKVDAVVVSEEVGMNKPDPRMVTLALAALGAMDAQRDPVWMIGDAAWQHEICGA
jgi:FMN phosphatase YigB (HAD superfamily)